jgi:hypothetical protein
VRLRSAATGLGAVALLAAAIRLVYGRGAIGYDTSFALVWGRQLAHGQSPEFQSAVAPTPHPLANLVSAPLSVLGDHAMDAWILLTIVAFASLAWFAYKLGERLFHPAVGILFAAIVLTRPSLANETLQAIVDIPFLALIVAAGWVAASRQRPLLVLTLLSFAGLLRPEGWPLAALFLVLVWRDLPTERRAAAVALAVSAPVLWMAFDLAVTGDPLYSLHGTQQLAADLDRPRGAHSALVAAPQYLRVILGAPIAWLGLAGCVAGLLLIYDAALGAAAVAGLGLIGFLVLGVAGLPILPRYLLVPGVALALFAAVAALGWLALPEDSRERKPWMAAGAAVAVLLVALVPSTVRDISDLRKFMDSRRGVQLQLRSLVRSPAGSAAIKACPHLSAPEHRPVPLLAYWLGRKPSEIPQESVVRRRGTAFLAYSSTQAAQRLSLSSNVQSLPPVPRGLVPAARNESWRIYASC